MVQGDNHRQQHIMAMLERGPMAMDEIVKQLPLVEIDAEQITATPAKGAQR